MRFEKWQALGNDYVMVESSELPWELTAGRVRRLCAAHVGVGSDGVLLLEPSAEERFVARLRIFNPDGSEAELSGNGAREAVMYLRRSGRVDRDEFEIVTAAGAIRPQITGETTCRLAMGRASTRSADFPSGPDDGRGELEAAGLLWRFRHISIGNPQCAIRVNDSEQLESLALGTIGPQIESHALFPNRTNVSFFCELEAGVIRARIFERGVGETLSSGTGASGAAVAYRLDGGPPAVSVRLDGGELGVEIGDDLAIALSGWAVPVYAGELSKNLIEELNATQ